MSRCWHVTWAGLMPACWSTPGYAWRALVLLLLGSWLIAGASGASHRGGCATAPMWAGPVGSSPQAWVELQTEPESPTRRR